MQHFSKTKGTLQLSPAKYNFVAKNCHIWLACAASQNCRVVVDKQDSRVAAGEAEHTTYCTDPCTLALTGTARTLLSRGCKSSSTQSPLHAATTQVRLQEASPPPFPWDSFKTADFNQLSLNCHTTFSWVCSGEFNKHKSGTCVFTPGVIGVAKLFKSQI